MGNGNSFTTAINNLLLDIYVLYFLESINKKVNEVNKPQLNKNIFSQTITFALISRIMISGIRFTVRQTVQTSSSDLHMSNIFFFLFPIYLGFMQIFIAKALVIN